MDGLVEAVVGRDQVLIFAVAKSECWLKKP
jgi:hypothetical protein